MHISLPDVHSPSTAQSFSGVMLVTSWIISGRYLSTKSKQSVCASPLSLLQTFVVKNSSISFCTPQMREERGKFSINLEGKLEVFTDETLNFDTSGMIDINYW